MRFAEKLRQLRISRGYTQQRLADALGTSQSSITAWESESREPDFRTIQRIAEYFHVPMSSLLPSEEVDQSYVDKVAEHLSNNPKLKMLFDRSKFLTDQDLDVVLGVVNAIQREREINE